jgi:choline-sulfatase
MKKLLGMAAGLCLVAGAIVLYRSLNQSPLFYREAISALPRETERFRADPIRGRIYYQTADSEEWLNELPNYKGGFFSLQQRMQIHFTPRYAKTSGLYSFIYFRSLGKGERMTFTLYRKRANDQQQLYRLRRNQAAFPLIIEPTLHKGDELVFEFLGQGIVYFSRPIFYRPTAFPEREYVFLVVPDTFRGDMIGAERRGVKLTPNIDGFKKDSVCFPNAFAQSSWTVPSFTSLFTALYPYRHGVGIGRLLDLSIQNLTSRLAERFITFGFHGGMGLRGHWGFARGFDHYEDFPPAGPLYPKGGRSLFEKAIAFVQKAAFPRTFLFLHTYQVHEPYTPPKEFLQRRDPALPYRRLSSFNSRNPEKTFSPVSDDLRQASQELYEAEIMAFDDYFGWFIRELRRLGIYDRSLIVLTSDHGEEFFEHGGWGHSHSLYNELLRVPLIIKFPGQEHAGASPGVLAGLIDVLPTLLDYYGLPTVDGPVDGLSLLPALSGKKPRRFLISDITTTRYNYHFPAKFALFFNKTKAIHNFPTSLELNSFFAAFGFPPQRPSLEWFDLSLDPRERQGKVPVQSKDAKALIRELLRVNQEIRRAMGGGGFSPAAPDDEAQRILHSLGYL